MQLPNFLKDPDLNALREQMGAAELGSFRLAFNVYRFTISDLERSLAGGIVGLASGRFSLGQVAVPVGTGVAAGTGVPIVTAMVTATI